MNGTIGANYDNALAALEIPGTEFYVPAPSMSMNCDTVEANIRLLNTFISTWQQRLRDAERQLIRSRTTISNCQTIIRNLSVKLGGYEALRTTCGITINNPPATGNESTTPAPVQNKSSNLLLWLGLAGVGLYAYKNRKKFKSKSK